MATSSQRSWLTALRLRSSRWANPGDSSPVHFANAWPGNRWEPCRGSLGSKGNFPKPRQDIQGRDRRQRKKHKRMQEAVSHQEKMGWRFAEAGKAAADTVKTMRELEDSVRAYLRAG